MRLEITHRPELDGAVGWNLPRATGQTSILNKRPTEDENLQRTCEISEFEALPICTVDGDCSVRWS